MESSDRRVQRILQIKGLRALTLSFWRFWRASRGPTRLNLRSPCIRLAWGEPCTWEDALYPLIVQPIRPRAFRTFPALVLGQRLTLRRTALQPVAFHPLQSC